MRGRGTSWTLRRAVVLPDQLPGRVKAVHALLTSNPVGGVRRVIWVAFHGKAAIGGPLVFGKALYG